MKISVYTSAFNLIKNNFKGWQKSLLSSSQLADEVVVAVNTSVDDTIQQIEALKLPNLIILQTNYQYTDPLLDGKIKNAALQACSGDILIQLDMDEYIPTCQHMVWRLCAQHLMSSPEIDCYMIPSLNLYKEPHLAKDISAKWYMHKRGFYRGPVGFARKADGTVDTYKSDTCELIDAYGCLVKTAKLPSDLKSLQDGAIFVVHFGYLDLQSRIDRNNEFWKEHWLLESGGVAPPHKVHTKLEEFDEDYFVHGLAI